MPFKVTDEMRRYRAEATMAGAGVSLGLCLFVLLCSAWIYAHKKARAQLDRVSFRLLLWAMGAQVIHDIVFLAKYNPTRIFDGGMGCGAVVYLRIATMCIVNYLSTSIAVNLMLTIRFGINSVEMRLERIYISLSLLLGIFIPVIPACLKHFGKDPLYRSCWFTSADTKTRILHFFMDFYLWQGISCVIAAGSVITTLVTLYQIRQAKGTEVSDAIDANNSFADGSQSIRPTQTRETCDHTVAKKTGLRRFFGRKSRCTCSTRPDPGDLTVTQLQERFLRITLRIALYPMIWMLMNITLIVGDLFTSIVGVRSLAAYRFVFLCVWLYGSKGIFVAGLCLLVDPCLYRGLRATWAERRERKAAAESNITYNPPSGTTLCGVEPEKSGMTSPYQPRVSLPNYSPTFVPPGESPGKLDDPLDVPEIVLPELRNPVEPVASAPEAIRPRTESDVTLDMRQALCATPSADRSRANSAMSMDINQALTMPSRYLSTLSGASAVNDRSSSSPTVATHPSVASLRGGRDSRKPSGRKRGSSGSSMDINQALAYAPRNASSVSLDITQALAAAPANGSVVPGVTTSPLLSARSRSSSQISPALLQRIHSPYSPSMREGQQDNHSDAGVSMGPYSSGRRPSLPRLWQGAFDVDPEANAVSSVPSVMLSPDIRGPVMYVGPNGVRGQMAERKKREWVKGMEKLFEEAEAQL